MARPAPAQESQRRAVLTHAVLAAADELGLTGAELAEIIGVSDSTVSRMRRGGYTLDPKEKSWELAALLVRLFRGLDSITGGDKQANVAWLATGNQHLHAVPKQLIRQVQGLVGTVAYVDAFRARV